MSISALILDTMLANGASAEMIVAVVKADQAEADARLAAKRENNADRQRRFKARKKQPITTDNGDNALPALPPPNDIYSNPPVSVIPIGITRAKSEIDEVFEGWNETAERVGLSKIRMPVSGKRRSAARARLAEHGLDGVRSALAAVERSPFCRGEKTDWKADFDFFVAPAKFQKLIEGGFDPPTIKSAEPTSFLEYTLQKQASR